MKILKLSALCRSYTDRVMVNQTIWAALNQRWCFLGKCLKIISVNLKKFLKEYICRKILGKPIPAISYLEDPQEILKNSKMRFWKNRNISVSATFLLKIFRHDHPMYAIHR